MEEDRQTIEGNIHIRSICLNDVKKIGVKMVKTGVVALIEEKMAKNNKYFKIAK